MLPQHVFSGVFEIPSAVEGVNCGVLTATWLSINHNEVHISASVWKLHPREAAGRLLPRSHPLHLLLLTDAPRTGVYEYGKYILQPRF